MVTRKLKFFMHVEGLRFLKKKHLSPAICSNETQTKEQEAVKMLNFWCCFSIHLFQTTERPKQLAVVQTEKKEDEKSGLVLLR